ncbi:BON domain-containing protein [Krasilnikovia sp. M28-CT-15]|uniref:BON domain-containing protein n=1 Tax=Krasilnikovia sp. M28-CT-15 TaxID=3373540 RepID=UPI003876FD77
MPTTGSLDPPCLGFLALTRHAGRGENGYEPQVTGATVIDADRKLRGIVSRSDLFKIRDRLDSVIRDDVMQRVLLDELGIRPGAVQVTVDDGVVTITGRTARRTTALAAARMAEQVPGVTDVVDLLTSDVHDTAAPAGSAHALRRRYPMPDAQLRHTAAVAS